MSLNKPDREKVIKAAEEANKPIKISASGGHVLVDTIKYTDAPNAINRIKKG
ncbi:hypothetical protein GO495_17615 [Chitinophaga oryziterrae]|uniref:Uncharacterized protein n=1 Tax=Chitinophaga oryziterrae TaxID=1031224 RepID=A0A6N8JAV6_9BACT|nr:hypothetical protein [Chitinophaga oryziterrae]MVT42415.1 hypothetical protein [Chitinophaga oryziterrae]